VRARGHAIAVNARESREASAPPAASAGWRDIPRTSTSAMWCAGSRAIFRGGFEPRCEECRITSACLLRSALGKALRAFHEALDEYSLQDLLVTRPLLEELFAGASAMSKSPPAPWFKRTS